ncbi:MAG: energy-coupling factor transporter transmembrane protein EcfT [Clostridia bacterium]|nr:energy-coupling factor transporter transmembrane protein EcfT [Clostridia bacterium]
MLKNITLGQYFPGDSFLHRLDPRTKLLSTLMLIVIVFVSGGFTGFALILAFVLLMTRVSGIRLRFLIRGVRPILVIVIFTFILNMFFQSGGRELFRIGPLRVTDEGLRQAFFLAARLLLLVTSSQLLTLTTSPIELTDGMESLMRPLTVIHFPAHEIAMMMSIALRFIPTLLEEANKIMRAQKARGADFDSGNVVRRAKAMIPLLVPLFVSAFRRAEELAMAMEARCYRGGVGRTRMRRLQYGARDAAAFLAMFALLGGVIALNILGAF